MSFIMDLPPDVETRLQQEATRQSVPAAEVALRLVTQHLPVSAPSEAEQFAQWVAVEKPNATEAEQKRLDAIAALIGKYAHLGGGMVEELHRERQADNERAARSYGVAP